MENSSVKILFFFHPSDLNNLVQVAYRNKNWTPSLFLKMLNITYLQIIHGNSNFVYLNAWNNAKENIQMCLNIVESGTMVNTFTQLQTCKQSWSFDKQSSHLTVKFKGGMISANHTSDKNIRLTRALCNVTLASLSEY